MLASRGTLNPATAMRRPSISQILAVVAALALTVGAVVLAARVEPTVPARLTLGGHLLFVRGRWEIGLAWLLAVAFVLLIAQVRRRPRLAVLSLVPLLVLAGWLAHPWLLDRQPAVEAFTAAGELPENHRRTLLVGVDAMSWSRILPLVAAGKMPNVARLMDEGSYGVLHSLRSYRPSVKEWGYWSPVVWTSIATGTTEAKHGIDDFSVRTPNGPRMAKSWYRKEPAFWNIFSAFHRPVGVVGWWASWPAEKVDGVMVSSSIGLRGHRGIRRIELDDESWLLRRRQLTWPESYKQVVAHDVGLPKGIGDWVETELYPFREYPILDDERLDTLLSVLWQDRLYLDTALHLLRTEDFSLYTTYFEGVDVVSHNFWQFIDFPEELRQQARFPVPDGFDADRHVVDRYYEIVDGYLGELLAAAGDDATVMVVSDHGFHSDPDHARKANHSPYGVILMKGPGIRRGHDLNLSLPGSLAELFGGGTAGGDRVTVLDVLPTLLYLHGLPISEQLDGRVLSETLERSLAGRRPELTVPTYGDFAATREIDVESADEDEYLQRMKALGYIR